ncbi:uncharacterized protein LOC106168925 [Lingula anatina]|uniref:Uncharacterized protein LOC106168925 n=1 Tax=Lingula anatina TaxID=7574 RepID=A0A1S3J067_LINAN|nr:uncharacterized protein LOC106168925 [Lingula anatina]|eukprot:XP_013403641.1 uncharacterized protein LOC106168925 [Lingula anatina]
MADAPQSKSAKKNKKRHNKKTSGSSGSGVPDASPGITPADLIPLLKQQLETAKINKDHGEAGKLREQLWILSDLAAGIRTDIPEDEYQKIVNSLPLPSNQQAVTKATDGASDSQTGSTLTPAEKRLKTLHKKLDQIEQLKAKKAKGETIQDNQEEKIKTEPQIKQEIEELEELMRTLLSGS